MNNQPAAYPDWKAPAAEGEILVWPEPAQILADTAANHFQLNQSKALIQNVPLTEVRKRMRQLVGIHDDEFAIFSGHQTELYHPGVWAKDALTTAAAGAMPAARAWHLAVDTDQPKHLDLRWPGGGMPFTDDPKRNSLPWCAGLKSPSDEHLKQIRSTFEAVAAGWPFQPAALEFLTAIESARSDQSVVESIIHATQAVDRAIGLNYATAVMSSLTESEPYCCLLAHLLSRADEVAAAYNTALATYRNLHKIRTMTRPMPDLHVAAHECEVPFWLDDLPAGTRKRAIVQREADGKWTLRAGHDQIVFDTNSDGWKAAGQLRSFLELHRLRLSPRALTLTMFVRLLMADQFVHGIGGGRYDQVTDALIAELFRIAPPKFSVTTATLYFPTAAEQKRVCLPCMEHEGHRLRHSILGREKMEIVQKIAALPRKSSERRVFFSRMHDRLETAALENPALRQWRERFEAAKLQSELEKTLSDRELFFAIQPKRRLQELLEKYQTRFNWRK
jgi:hypothetical protein